MSEKNSPDTPASGAGPDAGLRVADWIVGPVVRSEIVPTVITDGNGEVGRFSTSDLAHAAVVSLNAYDSNQALIAELVGAARRVLNGLDARIDAAPSTAKPVFDGIADLHDALSHAEAQQ